MLKVDVAAPFPRAGAQRLPATALCGNSPATSHPRGGFRKPSQVL